MANDHGLSGLFGEDGELRVKPAHEPAPEVEPEADLPPVLDNADKSPLDLLADKIGLDEGDEPAAPPPPRKPAPAAKEAVKPEPKPEPQAPEPAEKPSVAAPKADDAENEQVYDPFAAAISAGITMAAAPPEAKRGEARSSDGDDAGPAPRPAEGGAITSRQIGPRLGPEARGHRAFTAEAMPFEGGILCFLLTGNNDRGRRRTLEALNVAAGNGGVRLRALPSEREMMDEVLADAIATTDCTYVAFLSAGTEPADDWAAECAKAFRELPRAAAVSVRAANSDPLSPWARVAFFMDEAERREGRHAGFDTMVFRLKALKELGDHLGPAIRNGRLIQAIDGRGHAVSPAPEARVSIATPSDRREVMRYIREQARMAARASARRKNPLSRLFVATAIIAGYPFRILAVRKAAKDAVGSTQFREVASKAAAAVFADRRVRAWTMLFPGKDVS